VSSALGGGGADRVVVDYTSNARYNDTGGASSPAPTTKMDGLKTAIVVSGDIRSYQDGIVSGPLSENYGMPVVLTSPSGLSASARSLLVQGGFKQVILLGGPGAVSDAVVTQLTTPVASSGAGVEVFRVAGHDASDTAQLFAQFQTSQTLGQPGSDIDMYLTDNGAQNGGVLIARGTGFQDVLAAGPYASEFAYSPILLTENATTLGAPLASYLKLVASKGDVFSVEAIGGPKSITPAVQQAASTRRCPAWTCTRTPDRADRRGRPGPEQRRSPMPRATTGRGAIGPPSGCARRRTAGQLTDGRRRDR